MKTGVQPRHGWPLGSQAAKAKVCAQAVFPGVFKVRFKNRFLRKPRANACFKPLVFRKVAFVGVCQFQYTPTFFYDGREEVESLSQRSSQRYLVANVDGMVQQLVTLIAKGYRYYFVGAIKLHEDPHKIDARMLDYYDADLTKGQREVRKRHRRANFRYLRWHDWYIVLATEGSAPKFWREDRSRIRDVQNVPIRFKGYSISYQAGGYAKLTPEEKAERAAAWEAYKLAKAAGQQAQRPRFPRPPREKRYRVHVSLDEECYAGLKAYFLNIATHRQAPFIVSEFETLPYQRYAPVREKLKQILRTVNRARQRAGYQRIPWYVIAGRPRSKKVFTELPAESDDCRSTGDLEAA